MVHRVVWRVASTDALDFWEQRVGGERGDGFLRFADPEGLEHELAVVETEDAPLVADHPEIPKELALQGFDGVRAYSTDPEASRAALEETLAFAPAGNDAWEARGEERGGHYAYDPAPDEPGTMGAGAVHHVAWASTMDDHEEWQQRVARGGLRPTPVIDRFWFRSIYFREPSGVLFEIATLGPGFDVDEDPGAPRRGACAAARLRAPPRPARAGADSAAEPRARSPRSLTTRGPCSGPSR